jgi:hypothetical protein
MRWARTLAACRYQRTLKSFVRTFAVKAPPGLTEGEQHIFNTLNDKLDPAALAVQDVSGIHYIIPLENSQSNIGF